MPVRSTCQFIDKVVIERTARVAAGYGPKASLHSVLDLIRLDATLSTSQMLSTHLDVDTPAFGAWPRPDRAEDAFLNASRCATPRRHPSTRRPSC